MAYAAAAEPLKVPRTPLESRQGYHPKGEDQLVWRSPPTRQLTRQKRIEYESDVRERFYDDYIGTRTTGDAKNEVLSGVSKLKFDPQLYRANAYQGLVYDPMRPVPRGVDLKGALKTEKERERQRHAQEYRQRRMSDSFLTRPGYVSQPAQPFLEPLEPHRNLTGLSTQQNMYPNNERPRSALQKSMDETLTPDMVPAVEDWMSTANTQEKEVAMKFFRTLSSHGKRPDPASKAALHRTRVRSAVMTPTRKQRLDDKLAQSNYQQLSRDMATMDAAHYGKTQRSDPPRRRRSSSTERVVTKGSMFTAKTQKPSHFTIHPDWASEAKDNSHSRKRKY